MELDHEAAAYLTKGAWKSGNAAQCGKGAGVGVEQYFVPLTRVGRQPERPTRAQFEVGGLHPEVDATDHQAFFAPVELGGFAHFEPERNEGVRRFAFFVAPDPIVVGDLAVTACVTGSLDLCNQRLAVRRFCLARGASASSACSTVAW